MSHNKSDGESGEERDKDINETNEIDENFEKSIEKNEDRSNQAGRLEHKSHEQDEQSDSTLRLRDHLEGLPQELYDRIYDLTFTAAPKRCIYVPWKLIGWYDIGPGMLSINEKLPHLLHVDRRSREKFARSYFGDPKSFLAIHVAAMRNVPIESQHLELIPKLIFVRRQLTRLHSYDDRARHEMVAHGFGAAVVERFEFMSRKDFVARFKNQAPYSEGGREKQGKRVDNRGLTQSSTGYNNSAACMESISPW